MQLNKAMHRDRLLILLELWEDGFRSHAAAELLEQGTTYEIGRFAAQLALDHGSEEATVFCELIENGQSAAKRRAS